MIEVEIVNKIGEKIEEYQVRTGATKTWIAKQMGISRQALNILCKTPNPTIESIERVAYIINCVSRELYFVKIVDNRKK